MILPKWKKAEWRNCEERAQCIFCILAKCTKFYKTAFHLQILNELKISSTIEGLEKYMACVG